MKDQLYEKDNAWKKEANKIKKTNEGNMDQKCQMTGKGFEPLPPNYETGILTI